MSYQKQRNSFFCLCFAGNIHFLENLIFRLLRTTFLTALLRMLWIWMVTIFSMMEFSSQLAIHVTLTTCSSCFTVLIRLFSWIVLVFPVNIIFILFIFIISISLVVVVCNISILSDALLMVCGVTVRFCTIHMLRSTHSRSLATTNVRLTLGVQAITFAVLTFLREVEHEYPWEIVTKN